MRWRSCDWGVWIAFFFCVRESPWIKTLLLSVLLQPKSLEHYLSQEEPRLLNHLKSIGALTQLPYSLWFRRCFAGCLPECSLQRSVHCSLKKPDHHCSIAFVGSHQIYTVTCAFCQATEWKTAGHKAFYSLFTYVDTNGQALSCFPLASRLRVCWAVSFYFTYLHSDRAVYIYIFKACYHYSCAQWQLMTRGIA